MTSEWGLKHIAIAIASVLAVTACSSNDKSSSEGGYADVGGTAAKGVLRSALVTATELDATGGTLRSLGSAQTNDSGDYSLQMSSDYAGGPIQISVTADDDTTMACDMHSELCSFGSELAIEEGFTMNAIVASAEKGKALTLNATPVSHMAAELAKANPAGVNAAAVMAANSEVSQLVGVDITTIKPIDITVSGRTDSATADEKIFAAFNAGIGRIALESAGGLNAGIDAIGVAFNDGRLDDTDSGLSIADILDKVKSESNQSGLGADAALASLEQRAPNGVFDPEPLDVEVSDIAKGKALVKDVRTWITSIENQEDPLNSFGDDAELASELFDEEVEAVATVLSRVLEQIEMDIDLEGRDALIGNHVVEVSGSDATDETTELAVTVSPADDDNGVMLSIPSTPIAGSDVTLALDIKTNLPDEAVTGDEFSLEGLDLIVTGLVSNDVASITLKKASVMVTLAESVVVEVNGKSPIESESEDESESSSSDDESSAVEITSVSINGDVEISRTLPAEGDEAAVDITFAGVVGLELVERNDAEASSEAEADIEDDTEDMEGAESIYQEVEKLSPYEVEDDISMFDSTLVSFKSASLAGLIEASDGRRLNAKVALDVSNAADIDIEALQEGDETEDNFVKSTLTMSVDLALNGLPGSSVVLTVGRDALDDGSITATFIEMDGETSIERFKAVVESVKEAESDDAGTVTFKNANGVALLITAGTGDYEGVVNAAGVEVGHIEKRDDAYVIVWKDGSFETLM